MGIQLAQDLLPRAQLPKSFVDSLHITNPRQIHSRDIAALGCLPRFPEPIIQCRRMMLA